MNTSTYIFGQLIEILQMEKKYSKEIIKRIFKKQYKFIISTQTLPDNIWSIFGYGLEKNNTKFWCNHS